MLIPPYFSKWSIKFCSRILADSTFLISFGKFPQTKHFLVVPNLRGVHFSILHHFCLIFQRCVACAVHSIKINLSISEQCAYFYHTFARMVRNQTINIFSSPINQVYSAWIRMLGTVSESADAIMTYVLDLH